MGDFVIQSVWPYRDVCRWDRNRTIIDVSKVFDDLKCIFNYKKFFCIYILQKHLGNDEYIMCLGLVAGYFDNFGIFENIFGFFWGVIALFMRAFCV